MPASIAPLARTPLHHWHDQHGARFVERDGWQVVAGYATGAQEAAAAHGGLALVDGSALTKISLFGPGLAAAAHQLAGAGNAMRPCTAVPLHTGGPGMACRLTADHLLLLASTTNAAPLTAVLSSLQHEHALLQCDVTCAHADFWLIGGHIEDILRRLTSLDPASLAPPGSCAETAVAGVPALVVPTTELTVPALRICASWDLGEYLWESLLESGRGWEIAALGLEALNRLGRTPGR